MNPSAFFAGAIPGIGETVRLDRAESHHALTVLRLRAGAEIRLLDGRGTLARALVTARAGPLLECTVLAREVRPPPFPRIHAGSALPKGERQNVLLDMATQLGMASFTPLACERGVATAHAGAYARWERICRSACKQALAPYLPMLRPAATPADFVRALSAAGARVYLADPAGAAEVSLETPEEIGLVVGPEGGFTHAEREAMLDAGAHPLRLSAHVLRVETAVAAGLTLLQFLGGTDRNRIVKTE